MSLRHPRSDNGGSGHKYISRPYRRQPAKSLYTWRSDSGSIAKDSFDIQLHKKQHCMPSTCYEPTKRSRDGSLFVDMERLGIPFLGKADDLLPSYASRTELECVTNRKVFEPAHAT